MQEIFLFEKLGVSQEGKVIGRFRATGVRPKACDRLKAAGIHLPPDMCRYEERQPAISRELLDRACASYFLEESESQGNETKETK